MNLRTKITSKTVLIIIIILLLSSVTFNFVLWSKRAKLSAEIMQKISLIQNLENTVKEKDENLSLCYQDRGKVLTETEEIYDFKNFAVYSPLFEGQKVKVVKYSYKENEIIQKKIKLDNGLIIEVWFTSSPGEADFPMFQDYFCNPIMISKLRENWKKENLYINKEGIKTYWSYNVSNKIPIYTSINTSFFEPFSVLNTPVFVSIESFVSNEPLVSNKEVDENDPQIILAKKRLLEFVDTLSIKIN